MLEKILETVDFIKSKTNGFEPEIGIVLGSGLGGLVNVMEVQYTIPFADVPDFPISTVKGHKGQLVFGTISGRKVVAMQGRFHYYEGYSTSLITFPIRVIKYLGAKLLVLSNASGGINPSFRVSDIMFITDHINLLPNPLIGNNDERIGTRFPDMSDAYDHRLIVLADDVAKKLDIHIQHGVYVADSGPSYETPAEYRYYRIIGGDCVGMSTVPEVIVARHCGLTVFAVSVITDLGGATVNAVFSWEKAARLKLGETAKNSLTWQFSEHTIRNSADCGDFEREKILPSPVLSDAERLFGRRLRFYANRLTGVPMIGVAK